MVLIPPVFTVCNRQWPSKKNHRFSNNLIAKLFSTLIFIISNNSLFESRWLFSFTKRTIQSRQTFKICISLLSTLAISQHGFSVFFLAEQFSGLLHCIIFQQKHSLRDSMCALISKYYYCSATHLDGAEV